MKLLLLLLVVSLPVRAQMHLQLPEEELNPSAEEVLIKKPEKYLRDESMIYDLNNELGIRDQRRYTGGDRSRLSISGHLNGNYEHFNELLGFDLIWMRRTTRYNQFWWGAQLFQHRVYFENVTENATAGGTNSEASFQRPADVKDSVLGFGPGVGYRFKLLLDFFPTEDAFETVDVFVNRLSFNEKYIGKTYDGWGLTTNYGIHKRTSTSFFWGGKFSYNVGTVTRPAIDGESKSDRSLALGWLSIAAEIGLFY